MSVENSSQETAVRNLNEMQQLIAAAEENLLEQIRDLARRLIESQELHHAARDQSQAELEALHLENACLRQLLAEREEQLSGVSRPDAAPIEPDGSSDRFHGEIAALQEELRVKDAVIENLRAARIVAAGSSPEEVEAADYEAELNEFRRQIEADRQTLNAEIAHLRARNAELNDAAREAELELSRERAQLGRERAQLDRLREELRQEVERAQRDGSVHERLAPLQRLKEESGDRQRSPNAGTPAASKIPSDAGKSTGSWRNFLGRLGDPQSQK
jgi:hypothetical protein